MRRKFRFEDLEIWREAMEVTNLLLDIADDLDAKKLYRFAEQLRGAALSITNNIAEGSGSNSLKEFIQFLNFSRRSIFENANMLLLFEGRRLITEERKEMVLERLDRLSRKILTFQRRLREQSVESKEHSAKGKEP